MSKLVDDVEHDGGGAKGFYSIGFLGQLEAHLDNGPLCNSFDLIYGTSTGAIIGALVGLGENMSKISDLYFKIIPDVMSHDDPSARSARLKYHAEAIFGERKFGEFKTRVVIVATNYDFNRPAIFKNDIGQSYSMKSTFKPGFSCTIADATLASAAANRLRFIVWSFPQRPDSNSTWIKRRGQRH